MFDGVKNGIKRIAEFFEDGDTRLSSMRLLFVTWGMGTFFVFAYLSIKSGAFVPPPVSVLTFIGSLTAGKLIQNITENSQPSTQPPDKTGT